MIYGIHPDVLFGGGYAIFLVGVAVILERVAFHSHRLSKQLEVAGFKYHAAHDLWECPEGQHLERHRTDYQFRIVMYRAPAHACRACARREQCTDSADGRRIEHRLDSWLESELRRFHRGLSLVLLLLAGLILAAQMSSRDTFRDWLVILALLLPIAASGTQLLGRFFTSASKRGRPSAEDC
jgi:hypothetical protein